MALKQNNLSKRAIEQKLMQKGVNKDITKSCLEEFDDTLVAFKTAEKFMKTKMYEKYVKSFVEKGGMTLKAKLCLTVPVSLLLLFMFITIDSKIMKSVIDVKKINFI